MVSTKQQNYELKSYLYALVYKYRVYLASIMLMSIGAALFTLFVNYQIKEIIDTIAKDPKIDVTLLLWLFALYKMMNHGTFFIVRLFDIKYKPAMLAEIVESTYGKTIRHSLHWFDSHLSGEIASKITDFQDSIITIITVLNRSLVQLVTIVSGIIFLLLRSLVIAGRS